jgi:ZIP family zinc transporter
MPNAAVAAISGLVAGGALVLGAAIAWFVSVPPRIVAAIMAFGSGVLIAALAYSLVQEANADGGLLPTIIGFVGGAVLYVGFAALLNRRGAQHRKRSTELQSSESDKPGSGTAIALGALLDGIPESIVLGLSLVGGGSLSVPIFAAILISNLPEGLSSTAGMRANGRSARYVFGVWCSIAVVTSASALFGYLFLQDASPATIAIITTIAAGAILTMVSDTMIPEAFAENNLITGLIASLGFLASFAIYEAS